MNNPTSYSVDDFIHNMVTHTESILEKGNFVTGITFGRYFYADAGWTRGAA